MKSDCEKYTALADKVTLFVQAVQHLDVHWGNPGTIGTHVAGSSWWNATSIGVIGFSLSGAVLSAFVNVFRLETYDFLKTIAYIQEIKDSLGVHTRFVDTKQYKYKLKRKGPHYLK